MLINGPAHGQVIPVSGPFYTVLIPPKASSIMVGPIDPAAIVDKSKTEYTYKIVPMSMWKEHESRGITFVGMAEKDWNLKPRHISSLIDEVLGG